MDNSRESKRATAHRRRNKCVSVRVSEEELTMMKTLAEKSNLTLTDYAIWSLINPNKPIYTIDRFALSDIQVELARQGNNLNLLARSLNKLLADQVPDSEKERVLTTCADLIQKESQMRSNAIKAVFELQQKVYKTTLINTKL